MSINNDGWQKQQSVAQNIHDRGQRSVKDDQKAERAQAAKLIQSLHSAKPMDATQETKAPDAARQPLQAERQLPSSAQKGRAEVQDRASERTRTEASGSEFLKARESSRGLSDLVKKGAANEGRAAATQEAVLQKGRPEQAGIPKHHLPQPLPHAPNVAGRAQQPSTQRHEPRLPHLPRGSEAEDPKKAAEAALADPRLATPKAQTSSQSAFVAGAPLAAEKGPAVERGRESGSEEKRGEKSKGKEAKGASGIYSAGTREGRELGALLGGSAGGSDSGPGGEGAQGTEASAEEGRISERGRAGELPATDPHLKILNEYDEAAPGVELVLSKARLFGREVLKQRGALGERLKEIRKLSDAFDDSLVAFSKKIIARDEGERKMAKAILSEMLQRKSVYGGMIG